MLRVPPPPSGTRTATRAHNTRQHSNPQAATPRGPTHGHLELGGIPGLPRVPVKNGRDLGFHAVLGTVDGSGGWMDGSTATAGLELD